MNVNNVSEMASGWNSWIWTYYIIFMFHGYLKFQTKTECWQYYLKKSD